MYDGIWITGSPFGSTKTVSDVTRLLILPLMVSEGKQMMLFEPWLVLIPGFVLFALVLAINLLGDGLRDVTAPENRN